ncbi:MAG: Hpt domain-containing protein, partial [Promethearchaeota archaeon]
MATKEEIEMFVVEAEGHIQKGEKDILKFEKNPDDKKLIQDLFFGFQALKGLTSTIGLDKVSKFCLHFESLLGKAKENKGSMKKTSEFVNLIYESYDILHSVIERVKKGELKDIDDEILNNLKDTLEDFDSEYEITFINPIPPDEVQSTISDSKNNFYKIYVRIAETCRFKKVRLYFIFRALNKIGQICWSSPDPDILERGEFDLDFEIYFISQKNNEEVAQNLEEILEIENKIINELSSKAFEDIIKSFSLKWQKQRSKAAGKELSERKAPKEDKKKAIVTTTPKESIPRIIFTNGIEGMKDRIITVPNNHFIRLIN